MEMLKSFECDSYDLAIVGLGYESRSITFFESFKNTNITSCKCYAFGYDDHQDKIDYQKNKNFFSNNNVEIYENSNDLVLSKLSKDILKDITEPVNVIIDITVMTRHRLSACIWELFDCLPEGSNVTVSYTLSQFVSPPEVCPPVRTFQHVIDPLAGCLGDLNHPSTLVLGMGYEKGKALGVVNYLEADDVFLLSPKSPIVEFEAQVDIQNEDLLEVTPDSRVINYDVAYPYNTYVDLKILLNSLKGISRPLLLPLGPKILAAIAIVLGKEYYPYLPVWRVSSDHEEKPIDRPPSKGAIKFTVQL